MDEIKGLIKKRVLWWLIGSLGFVGIGIVLLVLLVAFVLLGVLVSSSDSSMAGIPVPYQQTFDIPAPLLPIYVHAGNDRVSWARLAAIQQVTTNFGAETAERMDTIGALGFPRLLWQTYQFDGDEDGKVDPDNPYDVIFSLANYFLLTTAVDEESLRPLLENQTEVERVHAKEAEYAAMLVIHHNWLWPLIGYTAISSPYGSRVDPVTGEEGVFHDGIDIPAPLGTPIVAIQDGTVMELSSGNDGYGNLIRLQHENHIQSFYGHLSKMGVKLGQRVQQGEVIGWVGSTGKSTGPHLHLGLNQNGQSVDPQTFWSDLPISE
jgi:murein DD-endopeptidase MepM/ murein hydrolase activator NlpD